MASRAAKARALDAELRRQQRVRGATKAEAAAEQDTAAGAERKRRLFTYAELTVDVGAEGSAALPAALAGLVGAEEWALAVGGATEALKRAKRAGRWRLLLTQYLVCLLYWSHLLVRRLAALEAEAYREAQDACASGTAHTNGRVQFRCRQEGGLSAPSPRPGARRRPHCLFVDVRFPMPASDVPAGAAEQEDAAVVNAAEQRQPFPYERRFEEEPPPPPPPPPPREEGTPRTAQLPV